MLPVILGTVGVAADVGLGAVGLAAGVAIGVLSAALRRRRHTASLVILVVTVIVGYVLLWAWNGVDASFAIGMSGLGFAGAYALSELEPHEDTTA